MAKRHRKIPPDPDIVASKSQHSPKRKKLNQSKPNPPSQPKANSITEPKPKAGEEHSKGRNQFLIPTDPSGEPSTPPGLSKRARKRRRLQQRKHSASASREHVGSSGSIDSRQYQQRPQDLPKSSNLPEEDVRNLFQQITRTILIRKPIKQWQSMDDGGHAGTEADIGAHRDMHGDTRPTIHQKASPAAQTRVRDKGVGGEDRTLKPKMTSPDAPIDGSQHRTAAMGNVSSRRSPSLSSATPERRPSEGSSIGRGHPAVKTPGATSTALPSNKFTASPPQSLQASSGAARKGLRSIRMDLNSLGMAIKPLSSMKASTIPTYSDSSDIQRAFKRFDNFANGRANSDSDDESEESEGSDSDSEVAGDSALRRISQTANLAGVEKKQTSDAPKASASQDAPKVIPSAGSPDEDESESETAEDIDSAGGHQSLNITAAEQKQSLSPAAEVLPVYDENKEDVDPQRAENARGPPSAEEDMNDGDEDDGAQLPSVAGENLLQLADETLLDQQIEREMSALHPSPGERESPRWENREQPTSLTTGTVQPDLETDLPLFSAFSAATTPRSSKKRSRESIYTRKSLSGIAPASHQKTEETEAATREDHEKVAAESIGSTPDPSDREADDGLFRSIEDISMEIFGATRSLPFGKLRRKSQRGEKLALTDFSSNKRLDAAALFAHHFARSSSPIVYICSSTQPDVSTITTPHGAQATPHDEGEEEVPSINAQGQKASSSPLSELGHTPTPPSNAERPLEELSYDDALADVPHQSEPSTRKKRKTTGITSKHFSPQMPTSKPRGRSAEEFDSHHVQSSPTEYVTPDTQAKRSTKRKSTAKKSTAKESEFFTPAESPSQQPIAEDATSVLKKRRVLAGTSTSIVPPTTQQYFGLIQEKLWDQPFWLMIAVTFLNKTAGKTAAPIFWKLKEQYQTPEALSEANVDDLVDMIYHLGLQTQRAKRLVSMAKTWSETPPAAAQRHRTLHYPVKGDGKGIKPLQVVEEDTEDCDGALEIGHIPGCGPYAWDSWRIFCRDVLRGVAENFDGKGAAEGFVPEWQRVLPKDKELRACLRWMWLREGWAWDCESGEKRRTTEEEAERGRLGEMEILDQQERKFAEQAADVEKDDPMIEAAGVDDQLDRSGVDAGEFTPINKGKRKFSEE